MTRVRTVVLWHGQHSNDGKARMAILEHRDGLFFGLKQPRLIGHAGHWQIVAEAYDYEASDDDRICA